MSSPPSISILIATHNRCVDLEQTLQDLHDSGAAQPHHQIIVIDNASTDATGEVIRRFQDRLPLLGLRESRPGKSNALNGALLHVTGDLCLFTDDDVSISPNWIAAFEQAAQQHPQHDFFGGRVISRWPVKPPKWFRENYLWLGLTPTQDEGDECLESSARNRLFFLGANLAIRRRVFEEGLRFNPEFGPKLTFGAAGGRHGAEDWMLQNDMVGQGRKGLYVPQSIVYHRDAAQRMTKKYLRWYYGHHGREEVLAGGLQDSQRRLLQAPLYLWKNLAAALAGWTLTRLTRPSTVWLRHEVNLIQTLAYIRTFRELSRKSASRTCT